MRGRLILVITVFVAFAIGCGGSSKVQRIGSDQVVDLSGNWNDTDARLVSESMILDCLNSRGITEFIRLNERPPVIVVGKVINKTDEHIDSGVFLNQIEAALLNSGKVKVVTNEQFRGHLLKEQAYQNNYGTVDPSTAARIGKQIGADFIMFGVISSKRDRDRKKEVVYYQVKLDLNNVSTADKAWIGLKEIKKLLNY